MRNLHSFLASSVIVGALLLYPCAMHAQEWSDAGSLYGQGVHAYFAGRTSQAESYLSSALAMEPGDPRLYYFRALALMRLGRVEEARGDMMVGADLEAQHPNRFAVGRALERVQGSNRLLVERYRQQGRADALTHRQQAQRERYPQTFDDESQVLRQRVVIPVDHLMQPGGPRPLTAEELADQPPLLPRGRQIYRPADGPRSGAAAAGGDPFRDDPQAATDAVPTVESAQPPATESAPDTEEIDGEAGASPFEAESSPAAEEPDDDPFGSL